MTQRIIGEYVKEPVTDNKMTAEERHEWYLLAKKHLTLLDSDNSLKQAIEEYEKRNNIK